jgi:quercetin 2,3-dioxygenase
MIDVRPYRGLGGGHHGWLNTRHHFSFADYQEDERENWGSLCVWNDNEIAPGSGFPTQPHADVDIITYIRQGAITHDDSLGNRARMEAGHVQVLSAGSGIRRSEYNLDDVPAHLFQLWLRPDRTGGSPKWSVRPFPKAPEAGHFVTLASGLRDDREAAPIRSGARVLGLRLAAGQRTQYWPDRQRYLYLVPARGRLRVNGLPAGERDGVAVAGEELLELEATGDCEILLVDTP